MKTALAALLFLALAPAAAPGETQPDDPEHSPRCQAARATLEALLVQTPPSPQLPQARRQMAQACLGAAGEAGRRPGASPAPLAVPPAFAMPHAVSGARPLAPAPPPVPVPRPTVITTCDPGGCWDSQGRRLNQMGPLLVGPQGACTAAGGLLNCP